MSMYVCVVTTYIRLGQHSPHLEYTPKVPAVPPNVSKQQQQQPRIRKHTKTPTRGQTYLQKVDSMPA